MVVELMNTIFPTTTPYYNAVLAKVHMGFDGNEANKDGKFYR